MTEELAELEPNAATPRWPFWRQAYARGNPLPAIKAKHLAEELKHAIMFQEPPLPLSRSAGREAGVRP